jgi:alkylhydroperoxidase family enzyme
MKKITSRVTAVCQQSDYPGTPDEATKKDLKEFFEYVGSRYPEPEGLVITGGHAGLAPLALNPRLALLVLKTTHCTLEKNTWAGQHYALRELAVQTVNLYFKCDPCFQAHLSVAKNAGISLEQQAALPYWRTAAHMFDEEQQLVIEYTNAVAAGNVSDELFSRVVKRYGEKGAVECTAVVALWSYWAMIMNATRVQFDFGYAQPGP